MGYTLKTRGGKMTSEGGSEGESYKGEAKGFG
jgi:hypothetical protein